MADAASYKTLIQLVKETQEEDKKEKKGAISQVEW